ncbi:MAG: tRNA lysidine(34) synthetase TilS [Deltaproteobacteria bacterium]|nr:tRNA lysidine(34) synthetase TilS [Deltaproteobacteria bacterium]
MLIANIRRTLQEECLVTNGDRMIVGVSGGVDSMVLLHLLHRCVRTLKLTLTVAHVNYRKRGSASDADEALVVAAAERLDCEVVVERPHVSLRGNFQDKARDVRRDFFCRLARRCGAASVALAHHQDDQVETILLHLVRGAGQKGLTGMAKRSLMDGITFIRPLLDLSRDEIMKVAQANRIAYREDASNEDVRYRRNHIRHELMPQLRKLNPRVARSVAQLGKTIAADEELLARLAEVGLNEMTVQSTTSSVWFSREAYLELPRPLRLRSLKMVFEQLAGGKRHLQGDHLQRMDFLATQTGGEKKRYPLPSPWIFERSGGALVIRQETHL